MQPNFILTKQLKRLASGCATGLLLSLQPLAAQVLVKDLAPGSTPSNPKDFKMVRSTLFFTAGTAATGRELYKSNGTAAGTGLVKDMYKSDGTATGTAVVKEFNENSASAELTLGSLTKSGSLLYFVERVQNQ